MRIGLPAAIVVAGLVLVSTAGAAAVAAGVVLIGGGLLVVLSNLLIRFGIESTEDRDREERARRYLDRRGRWPRSSA